MSRGRTGCVSFRLRRSCVQTTASPRAGACRLRRSGDGGCGKTNAASLKGIPKGLVPWAGAGRARRSPRGMVAWTRRPRGAQDGMLPSPGAPAKPFLKGRPFIHPTFPRDKPKSGAPTLKRFCPQGKQRRIRTPAAPLAPPGQGSVAQRAAGGRLLLVSLPPSAPAPAANGTNRSLSAPCSWGRQASPPSQRHWPPALPAQRHCRQEEIHESKGKV